MVHIMREMASYLGASYNHVASSYGGGGGGGGGVDPCERQQDAKCHVMCSNTPRGTTRTAGAMCRGLALCHERLDSKYNVAHST